MAVCAMHGCMTERTPPRRGNTPRQPQGRAAGRGARSGREPKVRRGVTLAEASPRAGVFSCALPALQGPRRAQWPALAERGFAQFADELAQAFGNGAPVPRERLLRVGDAYLANARRSRGSTAPSSPSAPGAETAAGWTGLRVSRGLRRPGGGCRAPAARRHPLHLGRWPMAPRPLRRPAISMSPKPHPRSWPRQRHSEGARPD